MDINFLLSLLIVLTFIIAVSQIILLLLFSNPHQTNTNNQNDEGKKLLDEVRDKTYQILNDSIKKANLILANAELKGINLLAKEKIDSHKLVAEYQNHLRSLEEELTKQFNLNLEKSQQAYQEYINSLEKDLTEHQVQNRQLLLDKTIAFIDKSEKELAAFVNQVNTRIKSQIDAELSSVKKEVEEYKLHRMKVIDQNLIDILEKTIEETLGKKLTLAEHSDLIFEALEDAKRQHTLNS